MFKDLAGKVWPTSKTRALYAVTAAIAYHQIAVTVLVNILTVVEVKLAVLTSARTAIALQ